MIAFQRRPDTRSFGAVTCGLSTANEQYTMSDGASLFLTVAVMADRTKFQYGGPIAPDEEVADPGDGTARRGVASGRGPLIPSPRPASAATASRSAPS